MQPQSLGLILPHRTHLTHLTHFIRLLIIASGFKNSFLTLSPHALTTDPKCMRAPHQTRVARFQIFGLQPAERIAARAVQRRPRGHRTEKSVSARTREPKFCPFLFWCKSQSIATKSVHCFEHMHGISLPYMHSSNADNCGTCRRMQNNMFNSSIPTQLFTLKKLYTL